MPFRNVVSIQIWNGNGKNGLRLSGLKMNRERYFVAVDLDHLQTCNHRHVNVTTATACIWEAGGYVLALSEGIYQGLTEAEEAEFLRAMYGRGEPEKRQVPDLGLGKLNPQQ